MTDRHAKPDTASPCGYGIFNGHELLVAFPSDAKARHVLQACEQDGYPTDKLEMGPVFREPPPQDERLAALEAELRQARLALAALAQQRDEMYGELVELRARL